jgi:hypothetical protein
MAQRKSLTIPLNSKIASRMACCWGLESHKKRMCSNISYFQQYGIWLLEQPTQLGTHWAAKLSVRTVSFYWMQGDCGSDAGSDDRCCLPPMLLR